MAFWAAAAIVTAVAYLIGSTPTGYLAGRLMKGLDIREHGSGSTGATNVLRTLGVWPFVAVLLIDVLKGAGAVLLAAWAYDWLGASAALGHWGVSVAGLAALLGHSRPVWLRFVGGKSVAAGLGVLLALAWPVALGALTVFGLALALWRIMSLGSMLAAATAVALICVLDYPPPYRLLVILGGAYVIVRHRANIRRLLAGTEPRVGRNADASAG